MNVSIFKSRSTIIVAFCFITLFCTNVLAYKAGFFNTEFAVITVYLCRDILKDTLTHQETTDKMEPGHSTSVTTESSTITPPKVP